MFYEQSQKVSELKHRLQSFMDRHVYPNEERFYREAEELGPWKVYPVVEELKPRPGRRGSGTCSCRKRARRRSDQPRICAAVRDDGAVASGARAVQLLGARHRQHGSAGALRHQGASGALAEAAAGRRNPLLLRHDRAGGGFQRRHQYRELDRARRRRLRHQRPQMVHHQRHRSALQDLHLHGQDRSGQSGPPSPAVDDPGADGHAGRQGAAADSGVRLLWRARPRLGSGVRATCACPLPTCCSARAAASKSRRAGSVPAASTTACG